MVQYRRNYVAGGTYFFTITLLNRQSSLLTDHIDDLRFAFKATMEKMPFEIDAIVILPEHIHAIFTLPEGDVNYSSRWRLIKSLFTRQLIKKGVALTRNHRGEYNLWQKRFWEHTIRDEDDMNHHIKYIQNNPAKHGLVANAIDWPYSSIHKRSP